MNLFNYLKTILFGRTFGDTIPSISPWYVNNTDKITQRVAGTTINITGLTNSQFLALDSNGNLISQAGGGASGVSSFNTRTGAVTLLSTDVTGALSYVPMSPTTGQYKTVITVGTSNADYVATGTHDGITIQTAYAAVVAKGGGKLFIKNGTYNFNDSTDRNFWDSSNVTVEAESYGGVIFQATASLWPGGSNRNGSYGMVTIGYNNTTMISDIQVRNIIFDCNHQDKTAGLTLRGGNGTLTNAIALQNVIIENVIVKNGQSSSTDVIEASSFVIGGTTNFGTFGYIDNVLFRNVEIGNNYQNGQWIMGTNNTRFSWDNCYIHDNNYNGVAIVDYGSVTTCSDWSVYRCRFDRNMILTSGSSMAHFLDSTQVGVYNFTVDHCYFGPTLNPGTSQDYALTPYQAGETRITNNYFDRGGSGISIGFSPHSASFVRINPIRKIYIEGNTFYQMRSCFDPDTTVDMLLRNNIFYEVKLGPIFAPYAEHFPTSIEGNLIYNCNVSDVSSPTSDSRSAFRLNGDGFVVKNNYIIDTRLLSNPTVASGYAFVAGGSLAARTYYVKYTWSNSTGETLASPSTTVSVPANQLIQVSNVATLYPDGARSFNIYIGTVSGSETLQGSYPLPTQEATWTEPATGLVSGTALPSSNTTSAQMNYGIYELPGGINAGQGTYGNIYQDNFFIGISTPILRNSQYSAIQSGNFSDLSLALGDESSVEFAPYSMGNITGATTFNVINGQTLSATLTGNVTATFSSGDYKGQRLTLILTQDGTGSRVMTWPGNVKLGNNNAFVLNTVAASVDVVTFIWDGTNWRELNRAPSFSTFPAAFTTGSIPFANSSGQLTQNNSQLFWDNTNNRLGIGTSTPLQALHVASGNVLLAKTYGIYWNDNSDQIRVEDNPTWLPAKQNTMTFKSYGASSVMGAYAWVETSSGGVKMMLDANSGNLGLGTITPQQAFTLGSGKQFAVEATPPGAPTLAGSTTGGSIAAGTYYYAIVGVSSTGGTTLIGTQSASVTTTGTTSSVVLTLPSTGQFYASFNIYRTTVSGTYTTPSLIASAITTTTYTDTLLNPSAGAPPTVTTAYTTTINSSGGNGGVVTNGINITGANSNNAIILNSNANLGFHTDGATLYIGASGGSIYFRPNGQANGSNQSYIDQNGNLGLAGRLLVAGTGTHYIAGKTFIGGTTTATAQLHLLAGTATAGTAPLKLTSGTNLTTPEAGAVEFDGTHFYGTVGTTRYQLDQQSGITLTTTGSSGAATLVGSTLNIPVYTGGGGGISRTITSISTATTAGATASTDYVYFVSGTTTLTLPTAVSNTNCYTVKNTGTATVTIATTSSQTITVANNTAITSITLAPGNSVDIISNNANWQAV